MPAFWEHLVPQKVIYAHLKILRFVVTFTHFYGPNPSLFQIINLWDSPKILSETWSETNEQSSPIGFDKIDNVSDFHQTQLCYFFSGYGRAPTTE